MNAILRALTFSAVTAIASLAMPAAAQTVNNGGFTTFTASGSDFGISTGTLGGWSVVGGGYNGVITTTQANAAGGFTGNGTNITLANVNNNSGGPTITASSNGGNFLAWENAGNTCGCYIYQTITGLSSGQQYTITFQQAGAVWNGGASVQTSDNWKVGWATTAANSVLAANQQTSTAMINKASPNAGWGFTGWLQQQITVTATATSMVLSFMANHPTGVSQPPFALLDGVTISSTAVPEPVSATLFLAGLGGLAALRRRRR